MDIVFWTALGVGGATVLGSGIGFLFKGISHRFSDIVLSFGLKNTYHHPSIKKLMSYYNDSVLWKKIKFVFEGNSYPYYI